jgi:hypothetical protein
MNPLFAKFLNSVYRKEPVSGFILIFGLTDVLLGGVGGRWNLFSVGLFLTIFAIAVRYLQERKIKTVKQKATTKYQLPPAASNPPLPLLVSKKRRR